MNTAAFSPEDLAALLPLVDYTDEQKKAGEPRRPPWTWAALNQVESRALGRLIDVYAATYNATLATEERELVPPCWRKHPGLAAELAVQFWLYHAVHWHPKSAAPTAAADFYGRHLPGFRGRVEKLLGTGAKDCVEGQHVQSWRRQLDELTAKYETRDETEANENIAALVDMHFGFQPM